MSHPMARCGGTEVGAGQVGKPRPGLSGTAWVRPEPTLVSAQQTPEPTPQRGVSRCRGTRSHRIPPAVRTLPSGRGEGCLTTSTSNSSQSCRVSGGHDPVPSTLGGRPVQRAEAEASVKRTEPDGLRFHFLTSSSKDSASRAGLAKAGRELPQTPPPAPLLPAPVARCAAETGDRQPRGAPGPVHAGRQRSRGRGTLRPWGPGWGLPGAPRPGPRPPGHVGASISLPRWPGTNLVPHEMSLFVLYQPWTTRAAWRPIKLHSTTSQDVAVF